MKKAIMQCYMLAASWLRRLLAGLSPQKGLGSCLGQFMWDLWFTKWQWDRFFSEFFNHQFYGH
jgi:hypothetical protein